MFVALYKPDGSVAWATQADIDEGEKEDKVWGRDIAGLDDGSMVVVALSSSGATFGAGEVNEQTIFEGLVVAKYAVAPEQDTSMPALAPDEMKEISGEICEAFKDKLQTCGVISQGEFGCMEPTVDEDKCVVSCYINAKCNELGDYMCGVFGGTSLEQCLTECTGNDLIVCDDGVNLIPSHWICDGTPDCEDETDEAGCPEFVCDDTGEVILSAWQCDGVEDCTDGSDEIDCPGFDCGDGTLIPESSVCDFEIDCLTLQDEIDCDDGFRCGSGELIAETEVCDFYVQCADGSDELGCDEGLVCGSGETISPAYVCDLFDDCRDGSDEANCTYFICDDGTELPRFYECDNEEDCEDGSDEHSGCADWQCDIDNS